MNRAAEKCGILLKCTNLYVVEESEGEERRERKEQRKKRKENTQRNNGWGLPWWCSG